MNEETNTTTDVPVERGHPDAYGELEAGTQEEAGAQDEAGAPDEAGVQDQANAEPDPQAEATSALTPPDWRRRVAFVVVPALAVGFGGAAGFLGWQYYAARGAATAADESVAAARDTTVAILSYRAETVEADLTAARDRLTGSFLDAYTELVTTVVIPGAKEKRISAAAQVPAAASVSATPTSAVALLFVNQSVSIGEDPPTSTSSSVRVTLDKVGERWLVSGFDPV